MSSTRTFPGGWYADALPGGEYVAMYHDARRYLDTHVGRVDYDPRVKRLLFPRMTAVGGLKIAGQDHANPHITPEWVQGRHGWTIHPQTPHGVSPVIYDATGRLHISDGSIGSQGWRYVDAVTGALVTGDATYAPTPPHRLFEWTDLGDGLIVGQGPHVGAWLWDGAHHRQIAPGVCRFIRASRDGDRVSIAYWREDGPSACHWMTVAELRACPIVTLVEKPFAKPAFFAPYCTHGAKYGTTSRFIGNVVFPDDVAAAKALPLKWPQMCGTDTYDVALAARYRYYYVHASAFDAAAKRQVDFFAGKPARDLVIYLDRREWPTSLPAWVPPHAILEGQAYLNPGESLTAFEAAMDTMFTAMRAFGRPLALATCHYDRNGAVDVAHVAQLTPIYIRLWRTFQFVGAQPFADMRQGRKDPTNPASPLVGGMHLYPALYDEAQRLFALIPAGPLPSFVHETPDRPEVPSRPEARSVLETLTMPVEILKGLRRRGAGILGCAPGTTDVYSDRTEAGSWEEVRMVLQDNGDLIAELVAAQGTVSVQPDGTIQLRPLGTNGQFERLRGGRYPDGAVRIFSEYSQLVMFEGIR